MAPEEITVYVCPSCNSWQRWSGVCDSGCSVQTVVVIYVPAEKK